MNIETPPPKQRITIVETTLPFGSEADRAYAQAFIESIVRARFAACGSREETQSTYWWEGELMSTREFVIRFKTTYQRSSELVTAIASRHPYVVPQIITYECITPLQAYGAWVSTETGEPCSGE